MYTAQGSHPMGIQGIPEVTMARFRPNFVLDGTAAHAEDDWLEIQLGDVRFRVERPCTRCSTVMVDQETGESDRVNWLRYAACCR